MRVIAHTPVIFKIEITIEIMLEHFVLMSKIEKVPRGIRGEKSSNTGSIVQARDIWVHEG